MLNRGKFWFFSFAPFFFCIYSAKDSPGPMKSRSMVNGTNTAIKMTRKQPRRRRGDAVSPIVFSTLTHASEKEREIGKKIRKIFITVYHNIVFDIDWLRSTWGVGVEHRACIHFTLSDRILFIYMYALHRTHTYIHTHTLYLM